MKTGQWLDLGTNIFNQAFVFSPDHIYWFRSRQSFTWHSSQFIEGFWWPPKLFFFFFYSRQCLGFLEPLMRSEDSSLRREVSGNVLRLIYIKVPVGRDANWRRFKCGCNLIHQKSFSSRTIVGALLGSFSDGIFSFWFTTSVKQLLAYQESCAESESGCYHQSKSENQ